MAGHRRSPLLLLPLVIACGEKEPPLPATIKYDVMFPGLRRDVGWHVRIGDSTVSPPSSGNSTMHELPSSVSLLTTKAEIVVPGSCKGATFPATLRYCGGKYNIPDAAAEKRHQARLMAEFQKVFLCVEVNPAPPALVSDPNAAKSSVLVDWGESKEKLHIGSLEITWQQQRPSVLSDCAGSPIKIGDREVGTYSPGRSDQVVFVSMDPALCHQHRIVEYSATGGAAGGKLLAGQGSWVIETDTIDHFLEPAPKEIQAHHTTKRAFRHEITRVPCPQPQ